MIASYFAPKSLHSWTQSCNICKLPVITLDRETNCSIVGFPHTTKRTFWWTVSNSLIATATVFRSLVTWSSVGLMTGGFGFGMFAICCRAAFMNGMSSRMALAIRMIISDVVALFKNLFNVVNSFFTSVANFCECPRILACFSTSLSPASSSYSSTTATQSSSSSTSSTTFLSRFFRSFLSLLVPCFFSILACCSSIK